MKNLLEAFIESNLNPFVMFDSEGNVLEYNKEGEYLLSQTNKEEIFNLAITYAPLHFGFKNIPINLHVGHTSFCTLQVGYIDSSSLGVMLYKDICTKKYRPKKSNLQKANLFTLLDLALQTNIPLQSEIVTDYDISIPEFKINIKSFLQFLNKIFRQLQEQKKIFIRVKMATGERIVIDGEKFPLILIEIATNKPIEIDDENYLYRIEQSRIIIELPLIL